MMCRSVVKMIALTVSEDDGSKGVIMDVKFSFRTWEGETPQVRGLHGLTPKQTPHDSPSSGGGAPAGSGTDCRERGRPVLLTYR